MWILIVILLVDGQPQVGLAQASAAWHCTDMMLEVRKQIPETQPAWISCQKVTIL